MWAAWLRICLDCLNPSDVTELTDAQFANSADSSLTGDGGEMQGGDYFAKFFVPITFAKL